MKKEHEIDNKNNKLIKLNKEKKDQDTIKLIQDMKKEHDI